MGTSIKIKYALVAIAMCVSCGSDSDSDAEAEEGKGAGEATGATCPSSSDLTYESFGRDFMEKYCTRCHSSKLTGAARMDAPPGHDFDTLTGVLAVAEHVDEYAAAGPDATNTVMPPSGATPSAEERRKLGEWLACELAK